MIKTLENMNRTELEIELAIVKKAETIIMQKEVMSNNLMVSKSDQMIIEMANEYGLDLAAISPRLKRVNR